MTDSTSTTSAPTITRHSTMACTVASTALTLVALLFLWGLVRAPLWR